MGYRLDPNSERSGWVPEPPKATLDYLRQERQQSTSQHRHVSAPNERHRQTSMDETLACGCGHLPQQHRRRTRSCIECDCARYQLPGPTRARRQFLPRDPGDMNPSREKRMKGPFG
jgi:hypothetical protein